MKSYRLLDQQKSTTDEVLKELELETAGSVWASKTNILAAGYVKHMTGVYGENWSKGFLPKELFFEILLPKHEHAVGADSCIFPLDTPITKALDFYKDSSSEYVNECMDAIVDLKKKILKEGFTSSIVLTVINDSLKHVDGLHRLLALMLAMHDGYEYEPIPVYLCNASE